MNFQIKGRLFHLLRSSYSQATLMIAALIPTFLLLLYFFSETKKLNGIAQEIGTIKQKEVFLSVQREKEKTNYAKVKNADHFYVDKFLEPFNFLEKEQKRLSNQQMDDRSAARLRFLQEQNRLFFKEQLLTHHNGIQEVLEIQQNPVEMDEEDLKKFLTYIEGTSIGGYQVPDHPPLFLIKNFELTKKAISSKESVYIVKTELIKRENSIKQAKS